MHESATGGSAFPVGRLWVVGAAGQVGSALLNDPRPGWEIVPLTSADIDITDAASVRTALADLARGDVLINCAAYTNVDGAESDPEGAALVNAIGPGHLATRTAGVGAWLIHISTDYVFGGAAAGGRSDDAPEMQVRTTPYEPDDVDLTVTPDTVYGATKLDGELAARAADPHTTVVRTAWVYTGGPGSRDFVGTMRRLESERDVISVVDDQTGSPTYARDLAAGLWELAARAGDETVTGRVLHATNTGAATWFEVARAVFAELGADPARVHPVTTDEFPRPAPRPAYSVLSPAAWTSAGLTPLRDWREALAAAVAHDAVETG
ncbi:dTDP-4-dehydrorhamnose reductase [Gordonia sp. NPDC003425]